MQAEYSPHLLKKFVSLGIKLESSKRFVVLLEVMTNMCIATGPQFSIWFLKFMNWKVRFLHRELKLWGLYWN